MPLRSVGHRAPLTWLVLPFIGGLSLAAAFELGHAPGWLAAAFIAASAAVRWHRRRGVWSLSIVVAMSSAGSASYILHRARLPAWDELPPREAALSLRIERLFVAADRTRASGIASITRAPTTLRDLVGQRVYFAVALRARDPPLVRSAIIAASGILQTLPANPPASTFEGYLAGAGVNFRFTRGRINATEKPALAYYRFCAAAAARCHHILGLGITRRPALAGLLRAMMLGDTHELNEEQHTLFLQSGTMHLFAISGLNIGVIATAMQVILTILRLPPWVRFALGALALWLFVDITGTSPSAIRAFAMTMFAQAAFVLRRPSNLLAALLASGFLVLLLAPLQVFSASFLMSYAIVAALLLLGVPLAEAWLARWTPWRRLPKASWNSWQRAGEFLWRSVATALAVGAATTLVSMLTSVQFFSLLTPGSLAVNLVLIPTAVLVTLGGFASLVCGLAGWAIGAAVFNHAAALVLLGIEAVVRVSVRLPGAYQAAHFSASWIGALALAALLGLLLFGYARRWTGVVLTCLPFLLLAVVLIACVHFG